MTTEIDDKVVAIKFDNAGFENKISDTIKQLDTLSRRIETAGSKNGLADLANSTNNFDMSHMGSAVEGISAKFLAMSTVAITILSNITTKVMATGAQVVKSFTLEPVMDGFREYETNVGAIQTILANTDRYGTTLDQVTASLDELNTYSDKTIYNFGEMVKNIGLFTNAGIRVEDATSMIQGFSNVAAASGTNAQGAAAAAYQLSQALSNGTVKLMDWKSLTNVGMGNKNMQEGLIKIADSMGTISESGTNADEVSAHFNETLEKGWLSADVMSNYLKIMAGDLSEADMATLGLDKTQVAWFKRQQGIAEEAATKVRTFTQLMGTVKESIGSSWSQTFRLVLGNFSEATTLFTGINSTIGNMVSNAADARNKVLEGWKFLGGRDVLIGGLMQAFKALMDIITPIKEAFRDIFPRKTALDLAKMTESFAEFTKGLIPSKDTVAKIRIAFWGFFSVLKIGFEVVKGVASVIGKLFGAIVGGSGGSAILDLASKFGLFFVQLQQGTLSADGIGKFFGAIGDKLAALVSVVVTAGAKIVGTVADIIGFIGGKLATAIKTIGGVIGGAGSAIINFFGSLFGNKDDSKKGDDKADKINKASANISVFSGIVEAASKVWGGFVNAIKAMGKGIGAIASAIAEFFGNIGGALGDAIASENFDRVLDLIKTGLLGGLLKVLHNFSKDGLKINFGGEMLEKIGGMFEELGDTLKSFQLKLKAEALQKIAVAIAILAASMVVLSFIDSDKLTKAMVAIGVGFTQLVTAMGVLSKITKDESGRKLVALAGTLVLLSGACLLLSFAVKKLGGMNFGEMMQGILGITLMLGAMAVASKVMATKTAGLLQVGLSMIGLSIALIILTWAMKGLNSLDMVGLGKGLIGMALAMLVLSKSLELIGEDKNVAAKGVALLLIAWSMKKMSEVIKDFAAIKIGDLVKGMGAVAIMLWLLTKAIKDMPANLPEIGLGIALITASLYGMALVVEKLGAMDIMSLVKGVGAIALTMWAMSSAAVAMETALPGAEAMIVMAGAMLVMSEVIKRLGSLDLITIVKGLAAMIATIAILAVTAFLLEPVTPMILALGVALMAVGAGFALFGIGAMLTAQAIMMLARAGDEGMKAFISIIEQVIKALPRFIGALAKGLVDAFTTFLSAFPDLIKMVGKLLSALFDLLITLVPKGMEVVGAIVAGIIQVIRDNGPNFVAAGFEIFMAFMQGIRDNAYELATMGVDIITQLGAAIVANAGQLVQTAVTVLTTFVDTLAANMWPLINAGVNFLVNLMDGITQNLPRLAESATALIGEFVKQTTLAMPFIVNSGVELLTSFLKGITENLASVAGTVTDLVVELIKQVGLNAPFIIASAAETLRKFLTGITDNLDTVVPAAGKLIAKLIEEVGKLATQISDAGAKAAVDFLAGLTKNVQPITDAIFDFVTEMITALGKNSQKFTDAVADFLIDVLNAVAGTIEKKTGELQLALLRIGVAIVDGMTFGVLSKVKDLADAAIKVAQGAIDAVKGFLHINSPSKVFFEIGQAIPEGMALALDQDTSVKNAAVKMVSGVVSGVGDSLKNAEPAVKQSAQVFVHGVLSAFTADKGDENSAAVFVKESTTQAADAFNKDTTAETAAANWANRVESATKPSIEHGFVRPNKGDKPVTPQPTPTATPAAPDQTTADVNQGIDETAAAAERKTTALREVGKKLGRALMDGMVVGIRQRAEFVVNEALAVATRAIEAVRNALQIRSPSKVFVKIGEYMVQGMAIGMSHDDVVRRRAVSMTESLVQTFNNSLTGIGSEIAKMEEFNPMVTPVLDLTRIQAQAKRMNRLTSMIPFTPDVSFQQARYISHTNDKRPEDAAPTESTGPSEVTFIQNNYSPKEMSTGDIYKNTKSQFASAKEELGI